ncbi:MAG: hypothetical protein P8Z31_12750 [Gammaproteobacteria bacterium]|jgi:hypothetical protein
MPILINELHTEVVETPEENEQPSEQASVASIPAEWLRMNCLLRERQARLEDD